MPLQKFMVRKPHLLTCMPFQKFIVRKPHLLVHSILGTYFQHYYAGSIENLNCPQMFHVGLQSQCSVFMVAGCIDFQFCGMRSPSLVTVWGIL